MTVSEQTSEFRAGGTDLMSRPHTGPYINLHEMPDLSGVTWGEDGSARLGALTTIAEIARDERLRAAYPALTLTAGALATPQIRAVATLGGNLLQRNRCWYFRNPAFTCYQNGGDSCPARAGLSLYSAVIDTSPCLAPHPSSMAMALLTYDAVVEVRGRGEIPVGDLYGSDPTRDHLLERGELLPAVRLPPPAAGERAAYHRAISRSEAEWPLVEAVARVVPGGAVAVAVGGVARVPLRLPEVEQALTGGEPLEAAAGRAAARCTPTASNGYKVALLTATVLEVLEQATA